MQRLIDFLKKTDTFLLFIVLMIFSLVSYFSQSGNVKQYRMPWGYQLTMKVNQWIGGIRYIFNMEQVNQELLKQNLQLKIMVSNYQAKENKPLIAYDSTFVNRSQNDSNRYQWGYAEVVDNSLALQNNYITIFKGSQDGVRIGMGLVTLQGYVVGRVVDVNNHFSSAMSVLSRNTTISARVRNTVAVGKVDWNGVDINIVQMSDVNTSTKVMIGDTIETSNYSSVFPPGILIGKVKRVTIIPTSNTYVLSVSLFTNFASLHWVNVVYNKYFEEQEAIKEY